MGIHRLSPEKYQQLAEENGLTYIGTHRRMRPLPDGEEEYEYRFAKGGPLSSDPVYWQCKNCGRTIHRCYTKMRFSPYACRCRSQMALKREDYESLAAELGIIFLGGKTLPRTNKERTVWKNKNGVKFRAAYHQLRWLGPPNYLMPYIDPDNYP